MPTRFASSRSERPARPSALTSSHAASRISRLVASRRSERRSLFVSPNTVRCCLTERLGCQPGDPRLPRFLGAPSGVSAHSLLRDPAYVHSPVASSERDEIVLIGPVGSGKSTQGRLLAARLGVPEVSVDDLRWG